MLLISESKDSLIFVAPPLVSAELLLVRRVDIWILRWPFHSLAREAYVVPGADVSILGVDIHAIGADSLGVEAMLLLIVLDLLDQVLSLVVRIPADPMQESKAIPHIVTVSPKLNSRFCLATNYGANLSLKQVHDAVRDAARLGDQQDHLLSVDLADYEKLPLPMHLKDRKFCARCDQDIHGVKVSL
jgi:hypothetical protein